MALAEGQMQLRSLVLGCGTVYQVIGFDPWSRTARADQGGPRAWNHGAWSGTEWIQARVVPIRVHIQAAARTVGSWLPLHQQLIAATEPVGDAALDVELRFVLGGAEYVMFGRPRMTETDTARVMKGRTTTELAFVALDPRIYSGVLNTQILGLPVTSGGLTVPFTVPFTVDGVLVDGRANITNAGLATTSLQFRIDGPVLGPRITLQRNDGLVQTLRLLFDLGAGQWVDIDTGAHTVLLNGSVNRRGQAAGEFPQLPPGTSTLRFMAGDFNVSAQLTARWRDSW